MTPELVNGWWMATNRLLGSTNTSNITQMQIENASNIYIYLNNLGWSLSAISGMLGNAQLESTFSPALIEGVHRSYLPNSADSLADVPNSVMINFYKDYYGASDNEFGVGLVQWSGYTSTTPAGQKLVSFAERYNMNWYDGQTQMFRIEREQATNLQWTSHTVNGTLWSWDNYPTNDETPEISARIWRWCYESADPGTESTRQENARYWYDYFTNNPPTPPFTLDPWILFAFNKKGNILKNRKVIN